MRLGLVIKKFRAMTEMTTRELAQQTGISFPTLNRLENGESIDSRNFMKLLNWLMTPVDQER